LKTIPGPGKIWLLDRWSEDIYQFSYDLQHKFKTHYAIWIPQEMAFDKKRGLALITYPLYHYAELLSLQTGALIEEVTDIRYPYACAYEPVQKSFWITDSTGALYKYFPLNNEAPVLLDNRLQKPAQIVFDFSGRAYVLDKRQNTIFVYTLTGNKEKSVRSFDDQPFNNLIFLDRNRNGTQLYFIDKNGDECNLYRYSTLTDSIEQIYKSPFLSIIRESPVDRTLWVAENEKQTAKIMQLSYAGIRLKTLTGFKYIQDFIINYYNGNLIIADRGAHKLLHIRPDGSLIGVYSDAPYPYKVYIE
ncbi:MAG: hypothetical protein GXO77_13165, partial [Calditrichaeota bacterium]|nr:hypothetical protein [Calditrichota bacterium]